MAVPTWQVVSFKHDPKTVAALFPGQPLPELAWSEIGYTAYCFVMPQVGEGRR
jgi:hypothetical protein